MADNIKLKITQTKFCKDKRLNAEACCASSRASSKSVQYILTYILHVMFCELNVENLMKSIKLRRECFILRCLINLKA